MDETARQCRPFQLAVQEGHKSMSKVSERLRQM